jgi:hypothetical protein
VHAEFGVENIKRDHLGHEDVDGKIILKWILMWHIVEFTGRLLRW